MLYLWESLVGLRQVCSEPPHGFSVRSLTAAGPSTPLCKGYEKAKRFFCIFVEVDKMSLSRRECPSYHTALQEGSVKSTENTPLKASPVHRAAVTYGKKKLDSVVAAGVGYFPLRRHLHASSQTVSLRGRLGEWHSLA